MVIIFNFFIFEFVDWVVGVIFVNISSSYLLDDCVVKQVIINGKLVGCVLDGVEGFYWLEVWVRFIIFCILLVSVFYQVVCEM